MLTRQASENTAGKARETILCVSMRAHKLCCPATTHGSPGRAPTGHQAELPQHYGMTWSGSQHSRDAL